MEIKSTYTLTRETAELVIKNISLDELSNTTLENILETLPQSEYRNYHITDGFNETTINSLEDFENI